MSSPPPRPRSGRLAPKLMRIIDEVLSCPDGAYEAFHLYIFAKAHIFSHWDLDSFGPIGNNRDNKRVDSQISKIMKDSCRKQPRGRERCPHVFFDFAAAKREIWNSVRECSSCERQQPPQDPSNPFPPPPQFPANALPSPPFSPCHRGSNLSLIEDLQTKAYGEIRSGIMLTLTKKLPVEICISIFEFVSLVECVGFPELSLHDRIILLTSSAISCVCIPKNLANNYSRYRRWRKRTFHWIL